jgi:hypothetical protein
MLLRYCTSHLSPTLPLLTSDSQIVLRDLPPLHWSILKYLAGFLRELSQTSHVRSPALSSPLLSFLLHSSWAVSLRSPTWKSQTSLLSLLRIALKAPVTTLVSSPPMQTMSDAVSNCFSTSWLLRTSPATTTVTLKTTCHPLDWCLLSLAASNKFFDSVRGPAYRPSRSQSLSLSLKLIRR